MLKMLKRWPPWLTDLVAAVAVTAVAFIITWILWDVVQPLPGLFFFPAVIFVSWKRGFRSSLVAAALATVAIEYFLPAGGFSVTLLNRLLFFAMAALTAAAVSRMREADRLRRQQTETLGVTLASIGDAVISTDINGRVQFINPAAEALTGWSADEAAGKDLSQILPLKSEDSEEPLANPVAEALSKGEVVRYTHHAIIATRDGRSTPIEESAAPVHSADGSIAGAVVVFHDVTQRRLAQRRLRAQQETSRILAEAMTLAEIASKIIQVMCETLLWDMGNIWRVDVREQVLRRVDTWHRLPDEAQPFIEATRNSVFKKGVGLPGRVWQEMKVAWIEDVRVDFNFPRALYALKSGIVSGFAFPILVGGEVFGVIEFFSRNRRTRDEEVLQMMAAIGAQLGQFIQRKTSQQALRETELRQSAILSAALDCIVTMDHHGDIVEWNPAAERVFGFRRDEAIGKPLAELIIPQPLRERHKRGLAHYVATGEGPLIGKRIELTALRANGTEFPVEVAITRITQQDPPLFTGFIRDITDRRRAEEELERQKNVAEAASQAKDKFLAMLSHELRTPLTPVLSGIDTLENPATPFQEVKSTLEIMRRNIQLERRLIDDLLDVTRIARGKLELNLEPIDAHRTLSQVLEVCRLELGSKKLDLQQRFDARDHFVHADPVRLQQIIWNLLKNAIKYTPEQGIITITTANTAAETLSVSVEDSGTGIDPELLPRVFDPFEQGESLRRTEGGLGLGLAIAKALAVAHGGSISAFSEGRGRGARFTLELRTAPESAVETRPLPRRKVTAGEVRILLVEDHEDTRQTLQRLLRRRGYFVESAVDVESALKLAEQRNFDMLISDIGLPDGNGADLMRQLREKNEIRGIALSGFGMESDMRKSREAGFAVHLVKPVSFETLEMAVQECIT